MAFIRKSNLSKPIVNLTVPKTGWSQAANLTQDRVLDADSTSTAELADVLGTVIRDLIAAKIIST